MAANHELMGGKLHVYKRPGSTVWQCSTYLDGRNWRVSTKEDSIEHAKDFAEDWYLSLKGKLRAGELKSGKTFKYAAAHFEKEYEAITLGERSPQYVEGLKLSIRVHLMPFFGHKTLAEITPGLVQQYRVHRMTSRKNPKTGEAMRPSRSTLHKEIIALRHVLKTAQRHGWIEFLPDLSPPYKSSPKIGHRAWFSPEEYKQLYEATRKRAENPPKPRWKGACLKMHDYVLFMVNTGLRPDEAKRLEYRDVQIVDDVSTGETILEISVRGKRGVGYCKSMPGAVLPFQRLKERRNPQPTDLIFGKVQRELFNTILNELGLKRDREGSLRTAYSLRHTYICLRLMEGADIYQVAKNCRTSVEMIEKFYAAHIKDMIDASAVNRMKKRPSDQKSKIRKRPSGRKSKREADAEREEAGE
jgi:integrase